MKTFLIIWTFATLAGSFILKYLRYRRDKEWEKLRLELERK